MTATVSIFAQIIDKIRLMDEDEQKFYDYNWIKKQSIRKVKNQVLVLDQNYQWRKL